MFWEIAKLYKQEYKAVDIESNKKEGIKRRIRIEDSKKT